uniref:EF-hand domain-containing protein n=1 Tax=Mucochytrium quahogii TaxID=96639 RepID=A0A7S2S8V8_9STRA|mmetsp:Transcript_13704/g.22355  ORF Transcript_13704/g.22355 Transcript_13704/m.22355 type:complete len:323 (+) Transcript_13704:130-1098(+)|eukprot:CAMPEP_0203761016 /NCGR_PEP_ID=MMETSP0098-20131031/14193_1 /ASSEMBLY_ACC=CAM_ASM_000208 /TAXON_ID=96639 /ORGANISM=" , Strain NY0313808BC1" /LENGTH=322 /DNA_ID=CAMNT_0050654819 /DNA_START=57 /DNA_END=1025 /DNA_ORIENTATION=+
MESSRKSKSNRGTLTKNASTRSTQSNRGSFGKNASTSSVRSKRSSSKYISTTSEGGGEGSRKKRPSRQQRGSSKIAPSEREGSIKESRKSVKKKGKGKDKAAVAANANQAIELLGITSKDIGKLRTKFDEADTDASGEIEIDEFFKMIDERKTSFTDALFALIDTDQNGTINFDEMMQVLTTYCIFSQEDVLNFVFAYHDRDGTGSLDEKEFINMCVEVNAEGLFPGNLNRAFRQFDTNDDGMIDFDEFKEINRRFPMLMFPAFRLQDQMQKCTLGSKRWTQILKYKAKRERIEAYMAAHDGEVPPLTGWKRFFPCFKPERL